MARTIDDWVSYFAHAGGDMDRDAIGENIAQIIHDEREACAKIADDHHTRINRAGHSEHGSQCLDQKCNEAIAKAIRNHD